MVSYCTHGITNAVAEGMSSKIVSSKRRFGGYRNRENSKTAILFYVAASISTHDKPGWTDLKGAGLTDE